MFISSPPHQVERRARKIDMVEILYSNYRKKIFKIKIVQNSISYKN